MIRPDINIKDVNSVHEFSCIPRSLFASDGSMLPYMYMDKSKLFHILRALYKEQDQNAQDQEDGSVLITDACPRASRNESFKTCLDLSAAFMASMTKSISGYITVHLFNTTQQHHQNKQQESVIRVVQAGHHIHVNTVHQSECIWRCSSVNPKQNIVWLNTFLKKHSCIRPIYSRWCNNQQDTRMSVTCVPAKRRQT